MPMDEARLSSIIKSRIAHCDSLSVGELDASRAEALQRYNGDLYGDEQEGQSQVVSRDVAEVVDGLMPGLMSVFASADKVCVFEPVGPEDEEAAKQATDYVAHLLSRQNQFTLNYVWFKDALLQRVGVVKSWWEVSEVESTEAFTGLSPEEAEALKADPGAEIVAEEADDEGSISLKLRYRRKKGEVRVCNVPPEEFFIDSRSIDCDTAPFVAHRLRKTRVELIADGFDAEIVDRLPRGSDVPSATAAERQRPERGDGQRDNDGDDEETRAIWITESYIRLDWDGDGSVGLRKVVTGGTGESVVLLNEPCEDGQPFSTLTPTIMGHKFFGKSITDDLLDIARIKTALMRQTLDNLYLTNMPEFAVVDDQVVDWDEMVTRRPGGIKRVKSAGAITPLAVPFMAGASLPMIAEFDAIRAARTGFRPGSGSLDPDALQNVAATTAILGNDAAHAREELIARTFAETGVKHLMRRLLRLVCKHQDKPATIRLRGKWVPMDPRAWNADMDMSADTGLGTGSKTRRQQAVAQMFGMVQGIVAQQGGLNGPLVTAQNAYAAVEKSLEALDIPGVERFISDPSAAPPQQPQPDPAQVAAQMQMQVEMAKVQAKAQADAMKAQADAQLAREKALAAQELAERQARFEIVLMREKAAAELEIERERNAAQIDLAREQAMAETALKIRGQNIDAMTAQQTAPVHDGGAVG